MKTLKNTKTLIFTGVVFFSILSFTSCGTDEQLDEVQEMEKHNKKIEKILKEQEELLKKKKEIKFENTEEKIQTSKYVDPKDVIPPTHG